MQQLTAATIDRTGECYCAGHALRLGQAAGEEVKRGSLASSARAVMHRVRERLGCFIRCQCSRSVSSARLASTCTHSQPAHMQPAHPYIMTPSLT